MADVMMIDYTTLAGVIVSILMAFGALAKLAGRKKYLDAVVMALDTIMDTAVLFTRFIDAFVDKSQKEIVLKAPTKEEMEALQAKIAEIIEQVNEIKKDLGI